MRILVAEDDPEVASYISKGLKENGFVVDIAPDGREALFMATEEAYDAIVLDRMLPKLEGLSVLKALRENGMDTPVLILSALSDVDHRVEGLKAGGDDYLCKPFSMAELIARIEVLLKRATTVESVPVLKVGTLHLDLLKRTVTRDGVSIDLKPREFRLLEYLMQNAEHVVTRTMLLEHVWDYNFDPQTNVIDVHMSRLRNKIDKGFDDKMLHTIRGAGYAIRDPLKK